MNDAKSCKMRKREKRKFECEIPDFGVWQQPNPMVRQAILGKNCDVPFGCSETQTNTMFGAMRTKHGPRLQREGLKKRTGSETTAPVQWGAPRKTATVRGAVGQTDFSRSHFGSGLAHVWASGRRNVPPDPSGNDVAMLGASGVGRT